MQVGFVCEVQLWACSLRFLVVTNSVPQHINLEERKCETITCTLQDLGAHCRMNTLSHTSYFCLLNWYCSSNFSASSSYIHSHNSFAFSLEGNTTHRGSSRAVLPTYKSLKVSLRLSGTLLLHILELVLVQVLDIQRFATLTQNLLFLLSLRLSFPAALLSLWVSVIACLMMQYWKQRIFYWKL